MISLYDVLEACNGQLFGETAAQIFANFCLDADKATDSALFVAMRGDYGDTHQEMKLAVDNGATGLLCASPPDFDTDGVTVIVVKDTESALTSWAQFILGRFKAKPIIVTGTANHATTIDAIQRVLSIKYNVHATLERTHPGRLHIPMALADLEPAHDFVVLDLQANLPGELAQSVQMVEPHVTVITSIGQAFLNRFESVESISEDHEVTVKYLPPSGLAVLNYNDDDVRQLQNLTRAKTITVGVDSYGPDLQAIKLIVNPNGTGFDLRYGDQTLVGRWTPLLGRHQLYSVLSAVAVGLHYDISIEDSIRALTDQTPLPGRMNTLIGENGCIIIDDTYDANPETTLAALDWMAEIKQRDRDSRFIFVMGDMDNLGDASRPAHRQLGLRATEVADVILTEGSQAAMLARAAQDVVGHIHQIYQTYSIRDAIDALRYDIHVDERDIVLVKGGSSSRMELVVQSLLPDANDHEQLVRQNAVEGLNITQRPMRPSWVEIDREQLASNIRVLKNFVGDKVALMATVKADAYGHGAVTVSRVALRNGADYLAVASISEALELRNATIDAPILVLSYTPVHAVRDAIRNHITITLYDLNLARSYQKVANELGGKLKVHVKVDTGMGRFGVLPDDAVKLFRHLITMPNLEIEGVYTHFSMADEDEEFTQEQLKVFKGILLPIRAAGIKLKYTHASNSAGTLLGETYHFNMVRTGILMYGGVASTLVEPLDKIQPLMTWKTVIAQVKTLPPGHAIGYGNTYVTRAEEKVAVIPVGYADGFRRSPNWGVVLVHGQRVPIRGRVSMEKTVIGVDNLESVAVGDEVVLLGKQGSQEITAEEIAVRLGTISYDVFTSVLPRVPRF